MLLAKEGQCKEEKPNGDSQANTTCTCSGESLMSVSSKLWSPNPQISQNNSGQLLNVFQKVVKYFKSTWVLFHYIMAWPAGLLLHRNNESKLYIEVEFKFIVIFYNHSQQG